MTIEPVDLGDLSVDPLNPRAVDPVRLELVKLSLSRFGHLSPIVASHDGLIVSGHQRSRAAAALGQTEVPVLWVKDVGELERGSRLLLLNLATNDSQGRLNFGTIAPDLDVEGLARSLQALPEIDLGDQANWHCLRQVERPLAEVAAANPDVAAGEPGFEGAWGLARGRYRIPLPIVVDPAGRILSGRLRLSAALWGRFDTVPVVECSGDPALVSACLNDVSMPYDLESYQDLFRSGVWLNHLWNRRRLGQGFLGWVAPGSSSVKFDINDPETNARFREIHGDYLADIGAGHMSETAILNKAGFRCVAFEPYLLNGSATPDLEATRKMVQVFLDEIAEGREFDSVFLSSVLNQVPFEEDRFRVLSLVRALCGPETTAYISTMHRGEPSWRTYQKGKQRPVFRGGEFEYVDLLVAGPEDGTYVSSMASGRAMIQKFHDPEELRHLCSQLWRSVEITKGSKHVHARCSDALPLRRALVVKMIEHEFDLPWPDGERLGMVAEAKAAFSKRLGIAL